MKPSDSRELDYLIDALGLPQSVALTGVHRTTFHRWQTGRARVPLAVLALLRIHAAQRLPSMGKDWDGWRFVGAQLVTPSNESVSPGQILAMPYRLAVIREQEKQIARLRALVEQLTAEVAQLGRAANDAHQWPYTDAVAVSASATSQSAGARVPMPSRRHRL